ncbi:acryloyl-CoA reductase [Paramagnetospirillum marisnigri]|uniref:Acryloyl-CoA reductase n=1 Tax=Paramagnetospirillum marisnigri TaxID=1285242 RepID=A0A178MTU8_9PROT|nr:MDR family oxidoreductase [Paramagnetospirillum marisnigri]OAN53133.1 acryloyl-CoA reductase [Paramagnetospirillum marisnigri]
MSDFPALMLDEDAGKVRASIRRLSEADLPAGDVLVRIDYSTLNYKDGLILNGLGRLVRTYPHVPGIDFAGTVEASDSAAYKPGDKVLLTGWRVGETHWGGFAAKARVKADWLVPLPEGLTARRAMAIGTAGFTAMLAINALEDHGLRPANGGDVLVTGAAGGLGSIAVVLLSKLGYAVAASTGRASQHDYLRGLGATSLIDRAEIGVAPPKPLLSERWSGVVDSVGGTTLANCVASLRMRAAVASCGNAGGVEFSGTVLPFLLRGASILGIDSVMCPLPRRLEAWKRLTELIPGELLDSLTEEARLSDLPELGGKILKGEIRGRVVVDVNR